MGSRLRILRLVKRTIMKKLLARRFVMYVRLVGSTRKGAHGVTRKKDRVRSGNVFQSTKVDRTMHGARTITGKSPQRLQAEVKKYQGTTSTTGTKTTTRVRMCENVGGEECWCCKKPKKQATAPQAKKEKKQANSGLARYGTKCYGAGTDMATRDAACP